MFMHHLFIIITVCVVYARIVAVSNELTHYGSRDNKRFTKCFISHAIN